MGDLELLVNHFIEKHNAMLHKNVEKISNLSICRLIFQTGMIESMVVQPKYRRKKYSAGQIQTENNTGQTV